jgi:hypothetical protein
MYDDPTTPKYKPNPNYNPDLPEVTEGPDGLVLSNLREFVDQTAGLALALGKIELERLHETALKKDEALKGEALNKCMHLLAKHRISPPDWLAECMLAQWPVKPRKNGLKREQVWEVYNESERLRTEGLNLDEVADRLGMAPSKLDRLRALYIRHWTV